jgi:RNA polymerase sigma-70 factor (ECF subfamily)
MLVDAGADLAAVAAVQAGERAAFAQLVRRHQRRAYNVCRAILVTHEDAEDAVQDGFFNAFRAIDTFRAGQSFPGWLYRIMANASLDLRRRRRVRATELLPDTLASPTQELADVITAFDAVRIGLDVLSERQRTVVVLHLVEGFSHSEIATMLGVPEGTSKSDLHIARQKVRDRLARLQIDSLG